jgi:outer membrane protein
MIPPTKTRRHSTRHPRFLAAVTIAFLLGPRAWAADPPQTLTLSECLAIAEKSHPDLAASRGHVEAAQAKMKGSRAGYLPRVDFSGYYTRQTYNYAPTPGISPAQFAAAAGPQTSATAPYYDIGLNLGQTIYDGGARRGTVSHFDAELHSAQQSLERTRDLIFLNVRQAYFTVLAAEEVVRVRTETVANQSKHLDQITAFYKVGRRPKIDVTNQSVVLATSQVDLRQSQENLEIARAALATAMGIPIEQAPEPANTLAETREPGALPDLLSEAAATRPDVHALQQQIAVAQADIVVARSAFRPNIGFSTFFNYRNLKFPLVYNWSLGAQIAQNLFAGFADRSHLEETQALERVAHASLASLLQQVRQEVFTDYADLKVAEDKIGLSLKAEEDARENLALAEGRYQAGYGNIIELTDAQLLSTQSQVQTITARYDYQIASARLDSALGRKPK